EDHVTKDEFKVLSGQSNRFVSRGGLKLEGALNRVSLDVQSFDVLDVGISTGGFTDCLLQREVKSVLGVDVGTRQIHPSLRGQKRLQVLENTHIKDFRTTKKFDLVVVDVSFISLKHVLPHLPSYIKSEGYLLALVKPQFELSAEKLGKGGIVKDSS